MRRVLSIDQEEELWEFYAGALEQAGGLRSTLGHQLDLVATMGAVVPTARGDGDDPARLLDAAQRNNRIRERLSECSDDSQRALAAYFAPLPPGLTDGLLEAFADDEREDPRKVHSARRGLVACALALWSASTGPSGVPGASAAAELRQVARSAKGKAACPDAAERIERLRVRSRLGLLEGMRQYAESVRAVKRREDERKLAHAKAVTAACLALVARRPLVFWGSPA